MKKILFIILAMISLSKMKNSVYNLIELEDSCIYDHCLTGFFVCQVTKDSFSMRLAQIYHKVTDCCIWLTSTAENELQVSVLNYCGETRNMKFNFRVS